MSNFLKSYICLLAMLLMSLAASCGDDEATFTEEDFTVSATELAFTSTGGTQQLLVTGNGNATVRRSVQWIEIAEQPGDGTTQVFDITVEASSEARNTTLTVECASYAHTVTITQSAPEPSPIASGKAMEIAPLMVPGWNLGNTIEGYISYNGESLLYTNNAGLEAETAWQATTTTQQVIDYVKSQGFKSVRIPCNWMNGHITDAASCTIDPEWINRVKEIVDYCIIAGLYVVLNDHYDGGWVQNSFDDLSSRAISDNCDKMTRLWTQIATAFINYDDHLLFAGLNEPACDNQAKTDALLQYEQAFIDAVRATGGNNATRVLIIQGPNTDIDLTYNYFSPTLLSDPAQGALMVEVHYYTPPQFTGVWENGHPFYFWGSDNHVGGSSNNSTSGEEYMLAQFQKMKSKFFDAGYPVILGEFGANWRSLASNQAEHDASIRLYHQRAVQYAIQCGMVPMVWDINVPDRQGDSGIMTLIDRSACSVFGTHAMQGIIAGTNNGQWPSR